MQNLTCLFVSGGGGGKGTWGKICEEYDDAGFLDANDPNYDEDNLVRLMC